MLTREEKLNHALGKLTDEEAATTLTAIVRWLIWKNIVKRVSWKTSEELKEKPVYNADMMYIVTQILLRIKG